MNYPPVNDGDIYENTSYNRESFTQTAQNSQAIFKIIIFLILSNVNSLNGFRES